MNASPLLKRQKRPLAYAAAVLLLFLLAGYNLFVNLNEQTIIIWDEARHGVNAYEMLRNNDWVVNTYQGEPDFFNLKPPLSMWNIMISFKLFGFTSFAFRLPSAVCILLNFLALTLWTRKRYGRLASLIALLLVATNPLMYQSHAGRTGDADAVFQLLSTLGMLCMLDSERDIRRLYGSAVCFGLAFLAKSVHAALIPLVCLLYLVCTGQIKKLRLKNYLLLLLFGLLPILPWAVARYLRDGSSFFIGMYATDILERAAHTLVVEQPRWYSAFLRLPQNPTVYFCILICAMGLGARLITRNKLSKEHVGLALWAVVPPAVFCLSRIIHTWYVMTILFALPIAAGISVAFLLKGPKLRLIKAAFCAALAVGAAFQVSVSLQAVQNLRPGTYQETLWEYLDRDFHSGVHAYVQYGEGDERWSDVTEWPAHDMLCAEMAGDVICLNGGADTFERDSEDALFIVDKLEIDYRLLEYYPIVYENAYLYVLEN